MAAGLTLIFGVMDIINIAQGVMVVLGGYLSYSISTHLGISLLPGLLITVPAMFLLGIAMELLFMRRLREQDRTGMSILVTFAVAILIEGVLSAIYGVDYVQLQASYADKSVHLLGFYLPYIYLIGFGLAALLLVVLYWILYRTKFGRAVRASLQNRTAADLIGVNVNRTRTISVGIGIGVAAVGAARVLRGARRGAADQAPGAVRPGSRAGAMSAGARRVGTAAALAVVLAFFGVFPVVFTNPTATSIAVFTLIFMTATTAWNIFSGYSAYLALGHAVFFGSGGYAVALAARDWHVPGGWEVFALLPFGGLIAFAFAIPFGLVALRVRRHTFVVVTIAIFFIFQLAAFNFGFTGGTSGILLPFAPFSAANYNQPFYYVALAILAFTVALS